MSTLSERLKHSRERKGLSQTEAARRININNKTLSRYEKGGSEPDLQTLKSLAELYGVTIDYLTGYRDTIKEEKEKYNTISKEELIRKEKEKIGDLIIKLPEHKRKLVEELIRTLQEKEDN